jgi:phytoene dehydrogenase-like protein
MPDVTSDAVVVGAGPNGLAAALTLARAGRSVRVLEAAPTPGGGARTAELTLPGYSHDVCSAIHPLALISPFFRSVDLTAHGVQWATPPVSYAQPLDDGTAALAYPSVTRTAEGLGRDAAAYRSLMAPLAAAAHEVMGEILGPIRVPRHPVPMARFALAGLRSARSLARSRFETEPARALMAGVAAHSMLSLDAVPTAAFALVLSLVGHAVGWPLPVGGSQVLMDALVAELRTHGVEVECDERVESLRQLPRESALLLDVTPRQLVAMSDGRLPERYLAALRRYRYGPGVFKVDWALDGPVPWTAEGCSSAGTVHLGGTLDEVAAAEGDVVAGRVPERPYVLVAQQSLFDATRAPAGHHTLWAYCHVPNGCDVDMTERIEAQVERFAPGFRERIIGRAVRGPAGYEAYSANYVGGDINGGVQDLRQLFTRPTWSLRPYRTPDRRVYLCSSSTPPGGGVHGMCGYWAAQEALSRAWSRP